MMTILSTRLKGWLTLATSLAILGAAPVAFAQGNSQGHANPNAQAHGSANLNASGKGGNIGHGNASSGIKGMIMTDKRIYYTGDTLAISLRFPRGAQLVSSGEVDASIIIFTPDSDAEPIVVPVSSEASPNVRKLFEIEEVDISALPAGQYQLGLVLTRPDGDPLMMSDWHNGLLGMLDVIGLRITDEAQEDDQDGDGMVDDDDDGDGFEDDDDEDEDSNSTTAS